MSSTAAGPRAASVSALKPEQPLGEPKRTPDARRSQALLTLKRRAQFLAIRGGARVSMRGFVIEAKRRVAHPTRAQGPQFGFTVTKKLGNAVVRNKIRRRLKAAVRAHCADLGVLGVDYVIVARPPALTLLFAELEQDLVVALKRIGKMLCQPAKPAPRP